MYILELNGLPGAGKTTLVNKLYRELKHEHKIGLLEEVIFMDQERRRDRYLIMFSALFNKSEINFNLKVLKFMFKYLNIDSLKYSLRLIKLNYQLNKAKNSGKYDMLLLCEGFIQYITSIPHDRKIIENVNFKDLCNS